MMIWGIFGLGLCFFFVVEGMEKKSLLLKRPHQESEIEEDDGNDDRGALRKSLADYLNSYDTRAKKTIKPEIEFMQGCPDQDLFTEYRRNMTELHEAFPSSSQFTVDYWCTGEKNFQHLNTDDLPSVLSDYFKHTKNVIAMVSAEDRERYKTARENILKFFYTRTKKYCKRECSCAQCMLPVGGSAASGGCAAVGIWSFHANPLVGSLCIAAAGINALICSNATVGCLCTDSKQCLCMNGTEKIESMRRPLKKCLKALEQLEVKTGKTE